MNLHLPLFSSAPFHIPDHYSPGLIVMASFNDTIKSVLPIAFQQVFPPSPSLTEQNLPCQKGKVFIVTGGISGIGYELATILFHAGAKVYVAGRSEVTARKSIKEMESSTSSSDSNGLIEYLPLELDDLGTIKASAERFKSQESRLDVLWNNAGVSLPPAGSVSKQGHELQMATNCLGHYLFTQMLLPLLRTTAKAAPQGTVRIVWTASQSMEQFAPVGGVHMPDLSTQSVDQTRSYGSSKAGNWFLATELARELGPLGLLSVANNPGSLKTNILRHTSRLFQLAVSPFLHDAKYGAYTELWAGITPELSMGDNGSYIIPWGRLHPFPRQDIFDGTKRVEEGGTGRAKEFRDWCDKQIVKYR